MESFRAKTNKLFHAINGLTASGIHKIALEYVQSKLDEYDLDVIDAVLVGSRCRGLEKEDSGINVVTELIITDDSNFDDDAEGKLFDIINDDKFYIECIGVNVKPIIEPETGGLAAFLPRVENYLSRFKAYREQIIVDDTVCPIIDSLIRKHVC